MFREEVQRVAGDVIHAAWDGMTRLGAIGPRHRRARAFARFGDGSMIVFPPTVIYGEGRIEIGERTTIGPLATLSAGMPSQADLRGEPVITIGNRTVLGKGVGVVGHERIEIGDDVWTGHYIYITDQNHGYSDPDIPIGRQVPVNRAVSIGAGSWLGAGAIVLPGARIGRNVVIAAGSVVRGEVPDYCVVAGVPAKVVRFRTEAGWVRPGASACADEATDDGETGKSPQGSAPKAHI